MVLVRSARRRKDWSRTKHLTLPEETYWKLLELKSWFKVETWEELIDELYERERKRRFVF